MQSGCGSPKMSSRVGSKTHHRTNHVILSPAPHIPTGPSWEGQVPLSGSTTCRRQMSRNKELKLWSEARLLAQLVGSYPVKQATPLYWHCFSIVCVDGVLSTLAQKVKPIRFKVFHQVSALNRQPYASTSTCSRRSPPGGISCPR